MRLATHHGRNSSEQEDEKADFPFMIFGLRASLLDYRRTESPTLLSQAKNSLTGRDEHCHSLVPTSTEKHFPDEFSVSGAPRPHAESGDRLSSAASGPPGRPRPAARPARSAPSATIQRQSATSHPGGHGPCPTRPVLPPPTRPGRLVERSDRDLHGPHVAPHQGHSDSGPGASATPATRCRVPARAESAPEPNTDPAAPIPVPRFGFRAMVPIRLARSSIPIRGSVSPEFSTAGLHAARHVCFRSRWAAWETGWTDGSYGS